MRKVPVSAAVRKEVEASFEYSAGMVERKGTTLAANKALGRLVALSGKLRRFNYNWSSHNAFYFSQQYVVGHSENGCKVQCLDISGSRRKSSLSTA